MKIELGKLYRTRDGQIARIICVDKKTDEPIVAIVSHKSYGDEVIEYYDDGRLYKDPVKESSYDLVREYKEKNSFWINIYDDYKSMGFISYKDRKDAITGSIGKRKHLLARVKVKFEEGEGLER